MSHSGDQARLPFVEADRLLEEIEEAEAIEEVKGEYRRYGVVCGSSHFRRLDGESIQAYRNRLSLWLQGRLA